MNKIFISILLFGLLVLLVLYLYGTSNTVADLADGPIKASDHILQTEKTNKNMGGSVVPTIKPSADIEEFNVYLSEHISAIGSSLKPTVLSNIVEDIGSDDFDINNAADRLMVIMEDPVKHQLVMRDLFSYCTALKKRELGTIETSINSQLAGENLLLALQKSGYCNHVGTNTDSFYVILDLARKGDRVAQLFLADDLAYAIERGLIQPKLYPVEYNDLRTEIIDYLKSLSARGVVRATINLKKVYDTSNFLLPKDQVMAYYYALLSEKQSNIQDLYYHSSDQLYDWLTESQKLRADRMTKQLK